MVDTLFVIAGLAMYFYTVHFYGWRMLQRKRAKMNDRMKAFRRYFK